jgi:hypothetical protein
MIRMLALVAALVFVSNTAAAQSAPPAATAPAGAAPAQAAAPAVAPAGAPAATAAPVAPPATAVPPPAPVPAVVQPVTPPPPQAAAPAPAPEQPRGRNIYAWGSVGTTFAYGQTYANVNLGVGYLMQHGITPNVEASYAFANSPTVWTLRPGVTWFLPVKLLHPYVGAYYTHWFVGGDRPDQDGVGARFGFSLGRIISLGVTYDRALGCSEDCDFWTPQISAGFSM